MTRPMGRPACTADRPIIYREIGTAAPDAVPRAAATGLQWIRHGSAAHHRRAWLPRPSLRICAATGIARGRDALTEVTQLRRPLWYDQQCSVGKRQSAECSMQMIHSGAARNECRPARGAIAEAGRRASTRAAVQRAVAWRMTWAD